MPVSFIRIYEQNFLIYHNFCLIYHRVGNILVSLKTRLSWIENVMKNEPEEFECSNVKHECAGPNPDPICL